MDALFYPSVEFGGGGAESWVDLLVFAKETEAAFVVRAHGVEMIAGYSETVYWSLAEEPLRPQKVLNRIVNSRLLAPVLNVHLEKAKGHFLLCGGDMCCEIIAYEEFEITKFATPNMARSKLAEAIVQ